MTVEEKIERALFAYVQELELDGVPLAWVNDEADPAAAPYIRVELKPNANERLFVGSADPHLRQGILQLTYVGALRVGATVGTTAAGAIAEQFPADLELFHEGLKVRIQQAPDVMQAVKTDVSSDVPISIRYEAFA